MATRKAKYLSKDESRGLRTNTIYDINTQVVNDKITVEVTQANQQAQMQYTSKREFLKDWLVID